MKTLNYKGKGEHSVRELELIIEQQAEELHLLKSGQKQLNIPVVGSSTFKVAISDHYCTYDFEILLPRITCIRDISNRLYGSFGLREEQGTLRK